MNSTLFALSFKSLRADGKYVLTATLTPFVTGIVLWFIDVSIVREHPIYFSWAFFCWWSLVWFLAFARSWTREHRRVEALEKHLLDEYVAHVTALHRVNTVWNVAHERDLASKIAGDEQLIRRAIESVKAPSSSANAQS